MNPVVLCILVGLSLICISFLLNIISDTQIESISENTEEEIGLIVVYDSACFIGGFGYVLIFIGAPVVYRIGMWSS